MFDEPTSDAEAVALMHETLTSVSAEEIAADLDATGDDDFGV